MPWSLNATEPGPWVGAYPRAITDQVVQHHWRAEYTANGGFTWPALTTCWDITVDLDLFRSPVAVLRAKATNLGPVGSWVRLYCGWTIDGVTTEGVVFFGMVTERHRVRPHGGPTDAWIEFEAHSAEACWDFPSNASHGISNSYTRVAQTQLGNVTWQAPNTLRVWEHPDLNIPTSPQLTAFRAMSISPGDNVDTFVRSMADSLGQRIAGDYRRRYAGAELAAYAVTPREPASNTALNLAGRVTDWRESVTIDRLATAVDITAQWLSGGNQQQSRRIYGGAGSDFTRQRSITVPMRPTGGSLEANDPTALAYMSSIASYPRRSTFTTRAIWWLDLLMHVVANNAEGGRPIIALTFDVDPGLMTITTAYP